MSVYVEILIVSLVCGMAASVQALTGFGFALVAVPLLAVMIDPVDAVVVATVVGLALTSLASHRERAHVVKAPAFRMTLGGFVGMPLGLLVLTRLDAADLRVAIALVVVVLVLLLWSGARGGAGAPAQWGSGAVSGALLTSTGMNGPPLVLTLQAMELQPQAFRATLQRIFQRQDLVAVLAFVAVGRVNVTTVIFALAGVVSIPVGWAWGDRLFGRVSPDKFRVVVMATLVLTAAASLITTL